MTLRARSPFVAALAATLCAALALVPLAGVQPAAADSEAAAADLTPGLRADIEELMRVSGASEIGLQMSNLMAAQMAVKLQQENPDVPERALEIVVDVVGSRMGAMAGTLHERLVPVYAKHFTHAEIKQLADFYATPLGAKLVETMPRLMQDSMGEGSRWAREIMPDIQTELERRFRAEGILGAEPDAPAPPAAGETNDMDRK